MVLGLYQQAVLGFLIGFCIIGYTILWQVLGIKKKIKEVEKEA